MREVLIRISICVGVILAILLIHNLVKYKKSRRHRQVLLPMLPIVYGVCAVWFVYKKYGDIIILQNLVSRQLQHAVDLILMLNVLFYACYLVVRAVLLLVNSIVQKRILFPQKVIGYFYQYHEKYNEWLLKEEWQSLRNLFRVLMYAGAVLSGLVLRMCWEFWRDFGKWHAMVFPVFVLMVLVEIYQFLSGYTEPEYLKDVGGEESYAKKIRNYYKMQGIYDKLFPHEVLVSGTGCDYSTVNNVKDLLEKLQKSDSVYEQKIADFFLLNGTADSYDTDSIIAMLRMLEGKNVVYFNPFYRDLSRYIILPILNTLLSDKYCLFVVGRNSAKADVIDWVREILYEYGKIESLWRVKELNFQNPECEVGVMSFTSLYDANIMEANEEFFCKVGFVFVLEASLIVNTGQIGLSILAQQMENSKNKPVYCIADRLADGLVDTLSHVLQDELLEVAAPPVSRNMHTYIGWKAEGDYLRQCLFEKQTKYLGNGMELAAVAIKNQIPQVSWFGETKIPILDVKWVASQYFATICKYMNLTIQQDSIYEKVHFIPNIWSVKEEDEQFVIAEDEFTNLFATIRTFLSRGKHQTFVNVLSENYLLRDYMRCNAMMFISNPNAIPSIVPDYAKTERNTLIKLLLMMRNREVAEQEIIHEFSLLGIQDEDGTRLMTQSLRKYMNVDNSLLHIRMERKAIDTGYYEEESYFSILPQQFQEVFGKTISNAYYICEEEKEKEYIDAKLFGNITQTVMAGYLLSYAGKYYRVEMVTAQNGVVLRRASNLYDGRRYYRQIRNYHFEEWNSEDILSLRTVMDVEIAQIEADFTVYTTGFLEMESNENLRTARVHDMSRDPKIDEYTRTYHKKTILRIKLPDTTDRIRFTICILLQEIIKSVFPDAWHYLAVVTAVPADVDGMLNYLIYGLEGDAEDEYIYIIEDSELDLGLLGAVEKNLKKFLELATDFLNWHYEKMREPARKDPKIITPEFPEVNYKRKKAFSQLVKRIGTLFGGKKENDVKIASVEKAERMKPKQELENADGTLNEQEKEAEAETIAHDNVSEEISVEKTEEQRKITTDKIAYPPAEMLEPEQGESPDLVAIDGTDIFDEDGTSEDNEYFEECFREVGIIPMEKSRYQNECYLKFGFEEVDERLKLEDVKKYLTVRGFGMNEFRKARTRDPLEDAIIDLNAEARCDFCGMPLSGVSYERLNDGRIRCNDCSASAIGSLQEFREIYFQCLTLMEGFFDIHFDVEITVKMADAHKIARGFGSVYRPTVDMDARVVGYAQKLFGKYSLFLENGSPRMETINTIVHEMTHIWQYRNWNTRGIDKLYPTQDQRDMVYEGMAVWASVQYLYLIGEYAYARKQETLCASRRDVYGDGFRLFSVKYPLTRDSAMLSYSPFKIFPPM